MEIDDIEYMDELLCGLENKVGATVPRCLLQPILAGSSSSLLPCSQGADAGGRGCSTPLRSGDECRSISPNSSPDIRGESTPEKVGDDGTSLIPAKIEDELSPIRQFNMKRRRLEDRFCQLRNDMNALRAMDVSLMKRFLSFYDAVEELRWMIESLDMSDSCESINSSVSESMEQIHEKWVTERRQWQSTSSQNLSTWRDDSRFSIGDVGRLNSTGGRRYVPGDMMGTSWRSPRHKDSMSSGFPEFTSRRMSNFERQRRSSVDHLPIIPKAETPPPQSPTGPRKRRSSSGALDLEAGVGEANDEENMTADGGSHVEIIKKPKFLYHSKSSPSFESQLNGLEVTDTAHI